MARKQDARGKRQVRTKITLGWRTGSQFRQPEKSVPDLHERWRMGQSMASAPSASGNLRRLGKAPQAGVPGSVRHFDGMRLRPGEIGLILAPMASHPPTVGIYYIPALYYIGISQQVFRFAAAA